MLVEWLSGALSKISAVWIAIELDSFSEQDSHSSSSSEAWQRFFSEGAFTDSSCENSYIALYSIRSSLSVHFSVTFPRDFSSKLCRPINNSSCIFLNQSSSDPSLRSEIYFMELLISFFSLEKTPMNGSSSGSSGSSSISSSSSDY